MQVKDKIVIVTGASSGIGLATAKLLTEKGAKVVLVSRSKNKLEKISKKLPGSFFVPCDMTKVQDIKAMVEKVKNHYGRIYILVNNAGQGYDADVQDINIKFFQRIFELDLVGPIIAMQEVIPIMKKQKEGSIINISSGTALMVLPGMSPYSSMKKALSQVSLTAREELKEDNINVSVVYPYITLTDFEKNTIKEKSSSEQSDEDYDSNLPPFDSPKYVAEKILEAIKNQEAETFAHGWMKPN